MFDAGVIIKGKQDAQYESMIREQEKSVEKLDNLQSLLKFFDFDGWKDFQEGYLLNKRLPQLYRASSTNLGAEESIRMRLAGQIAEAERLAMKKNDVVMQITILTKQIETAQVSIDEENKKRNGGK